MKRYCNKRYHHFLTQQLIPLLLLLLLLLSTTTTIVNSQSIQGYIYWDTNANGILDGLDNNNDSGSNSNDKKSELENGIIDVTVQVHSCYSTDDDDDDVITKGITLWPQTYQDEYERIPGHSAIYPYGGYYILDLKGSDDNEKPNCLLTNEKYTTSDFNKNEDIGGCYLSVVAPLDYEITSSFPFNTNDEEEEGWPSSVYKEEEQEEEERWEDPFSWIPYNDNLWNIPTSNKKNDKEENTQPNRGYQARTKQCFGYHTGSRMWYVWTPVYSTTSSSSLSSSSNNANAKQIQLPNDNNYGYSQYLPIQETYNHILSITPVGMYYTANSWPLPLRVRSDLVLGMEFATNGSNGAVLLSNGEDRFTFEYLDTTISLSQYLSKVQQQSGGDQTPLPEQYNSNNTSTNYIHTNNYGMLYTPQILKEVIQSILTDKVFNGGRSGDGASGNGQELQSQYMNVNYMWSNMEVLDFSSRRRKKRGLLRGLTSGEERQPSGWDGTWALRVSSMAIDSSSATKDRLLRGSSSGIRGSNTDLQRGHRSLVSLPKPHLIFSLQVIAKYTERQPSNQLSTNEPRPSEVASMENQAIKTTQGFGKYTSRLMNVWRSELIKRMRMRSGYGQECNAVGSDEGSAAASPEEEEESFLQGYTPIAISDEEFNPNAGINGGVQQSGGDEYTEVSIGVVNRFDCDKLLPLYYYELDVLAVREMDNVNGDVNDMERLDRAIELLAMNDGIDGPPSAYLQGEENDTSSSSSGMPVWLLSTIIVIVILAMFAFAGGLYVRKERKKLKLEKERRRRVKAERLAAKEERRMRKAKKKERKERRKKQSREVVDSLIGKDIEGVNDDDVVDTEEGRLTRSLPTPNTKNMSSFVSKDESEDSELDRLFASANSGANKSAQSVDSPKPITAQEATVALLSVNGLHNNKPLRRRKKTVDSNPDTAPLESSNASGLNYSSRTDDKSKDVSTRSGKEVSSVAQEDGKLEDTGNGKDKGVQEQSEQNERKEKAVPPRPTMRSMASMRMSRKWDDKIDKKIRKKKLSIDKSDRDQDGPASSRRRPRKAAAALVSSFRGKKGDTASPAVEGDAATKEKQVKQKDTIKSPAPKRGMAGFKGMASMRMSVKSMLIGELSSESEVEDSDDDSSSSDGSSIEEPITKTKPQQANVGTVKSIPKVSNVDFNQKDDKPQDDDVQPERRDGSKRHLGEQNTDLHQSEVTRTNDYLPGLHKAPEHQPQQEDNLLDLSRRSNASKASSKASSKRSKRSSKDHSSREFNKSLESVQSSRHSDRKRSSKHHKTSSSKRHTTDHERRHRHHDKKKKESRRKPRPSLSQLKSSITSSFKGMKDGKALSGVAASTLGEQKALDKSEKQSERGTKKKRHHSNKSELDRHSERSHSKSLESVQSYKPSERSHSKPSERDHSRSLESIQSRKKKSSRHKKKSSHHHDKKHASKHRSSKDHDHTDYKRKTTL